MNRRSLDGMLAQIGGDLLPRGRQGVERRIPIQLLETLALTADIKATLGVPLREALSLAQQLTSISATNDPASGQANRTGHSGLPVGEFATFVVHREALRASLERRLESAIESVVRPRRGRPRARE